MAQHDTTVRRAVAAAQELEEHATCLNCMIKQTPPRDCPLGLKICKYERERS